MQSIHKLVAMLFIWGAFALASMVNVGLADPMEAENVFVALFFVIAALAATRYLMSAPLPGTTEEAAFKAKRSGRVERMLASLNDDELDALRDRLSDNDGEVVSLEEVLRQQRRDRG